MTAELPPPPGRRTNGLQASEWGALLDLDPRLSPGLLDRLAAAGVAAYVEPAAGRTDGFSRATVLPPRPLDRLWVDVVRAEAARTVVGAEVADLTALLAEEDPSANAAGLVSEVPRGSAGKVLAPPPLPQPPSRAARNDDDEFRRIVEGFTTGPAGPVAPWPAQEDVDETGRKTWRPRRREEISPGSDEDEPVEPLPAWLEPDAIEEDPQAPEPRYVPPPPPPAPRLRPRTVGAIAAVLLGVVLTFAPGLLDQPQSGEVMLLGVALFAGGAVGLLMGVRDAPDEDRGPDDGAVV